MAEHATTLTFTHEHARIPKATLTRLARRLKPEITRLREAKSYTDPRSAINLCVDDSARLASLRLARRLKPVDLVIVCGIGGSNLGTLAVQEAILSRQHNLLGNKPRILYADTVDTVAMEGILAQLKRTLTAGGKPVVIGVSKSGTTTETIANLELLLKELKRHDANYHEHVVLITDDGSKLWQHATTEGYAHLAIPKKVGGRYSVLSAVGLFPLTLLSINTKQLLTGAAAMRERGLADELDENWPALSAALLAANAQRGRTIADTFAFAPDLEGIGKWYRQLMAESVGKEYNAAGTKRVWAGITPTVSIGSTDLHSMAQLYLGGPRDKYTTFLSVSEGGIQLPHWKAYDKLVPHLQGKSLASIMQAILSGTKQAYQKGKRPFCEIELADRSERSIGEFLQFKMMELIYLAHLLNVNAFDQPNVEAYKQETRAILAKG